MRKKKTATVVNTPIENVLIDSSMAYALTNAIRMIPNVIDGLKPSQRRILYVLHKELKNTSSFIKSSRVVGEVMGKYHPHGDMAIYQTIVNLAQKDRTRYPYLTGQGNFGWVGEDLNGYAAARYTEVKLSKFADRNFFQDYYKFLEYSKTYDNQRDEPVVLCPLIPMVLVRGTTGVTTGFKNDIPPHNFVSVCNSYIEYIKTMNNPNWEKIANKIKVEFPTKCLVEGNKVEGLLTGTGQLRLTSQYKFKEYSYGRLVMEVRELPYLTSPKKIINNILAKDNWKEYIHDIHDVSDKKKVGLDIILKKGISKEQAIEYLLGKKSKTGIKDTYNYSMNLISKGKLPINMSIKEIYREHYDYLYNVLEKSLLFKKKKLSEDDVFYSIIYSIIKDKKQAQDFILLLTTYNRKLLYKKLNIIYKIDASMVDRILDSNISTLTKASEIKEKLKNIKKDIKETNVKLNDLQVYIIYMIEQIRDDKYNTID